MTVFAVNDPGASMDSRLLGQHLAESYRVLRRIGAGGMGQVYEAEHTHLGRHFALKVLDTEQATRRDAVSRFFAEARAASQIEHPHIVDVVHFVTDGPFMVLVMELLRGESLAERLTRGPLPLSDAVRVLSQICDALAATHAAGILHRDLKPANVFLCDHPEGLHAKVLDFGISKLKPGAAAEADATKDGELAVGVTTTGQLLGTPRYLSPEQARGAPEIDERADVYAAGVVLFEMIAGRPPFDGQNAFQLIWKHGNEPAPPLSEHATDIPPALEAVVARALAKEPAERFDSMLALRDAVQRAVQGDTDPAAAPHAVALQPAHGRRRIRIGVVGPLLLAGAASLTLGGWLLFDGPRAQPAYNATPREGGAATGAAGDTTATVTASDPDVARHVEGALPASAATRAAAASADAAHTAPAPTAERQLRIPLRLTPHDARVAVDGGEPRPASEPLEVVAGQALTLTFTAPGYATEVRRLTPETEDELSVALTRRRGRQARGGSRSPIKRQF